MPRLSIPLFHGTSTALLTSIESHGLGGGDPVSALDAVACLNALSSLAEVALSRDEWWASEADCIHRMCAQSISAAGFNFRHGQTYVSASELTAVRYAITNCVGSELLSTCIELRERVAHFPNKRLAAIEFQYRDLFSLSEGNPRPLLLRLDGVRTEQLLSETGGPPNDVLASIESLASIGLPEALQGHNFILSTPLPIGALRAFEIDVSPGDPSFPKYSLREHVRNVT